MPAIFKPGSVGRVTKAWHAIYPDPITFRAGDELALGVRDAEWPGWIWCTNHAGKSGWVPESYLEGHGGERGWAARDYTATELEAQVGERLTLHQIESGWFWATNRAGQSGWFPANHLELQPTRGGVGCGEAIP
jgi:hypothetical protein